MIKRIRILIPLTLASLALAAGSAQAADTPPSDVACLVSAIKLTASDDPGMKNAGLLAAFYFWGKVDAGPPQPHLEDDIIALLVKTTPEEAAAIQRGCGTELKQRGQAMIDLGKHLQERGAALGAPHT